MYSIYNNRFTEQEDVIPTIGFAVLLIVFLGSIMLVGAIL